MQLKHGSTWSKATSRALRPGSRRTPPWETVHNAPLGGTNRGPRSPPRSPTDQDGSYLAEPVHILPEVSNQGAGPDHPPPAECRTTPPLRPGTGGVSLIRRDTVPPWPWISRYGVRCGGPGAARAARRWPFPRAAVPRTTRPASLPGVRASAPAATPSAPSASSGGSASGTEWGCYAKSRQFDHDPGQRGKLGAPYRAPRYFRKSGTSNSSAGLSW